MTVWAYYRVSSDEQNYESQKVGVIEYAKKIGVTIHKEVVDDGVSGTVPAKHRNFWKIVRNSKSGDLLITGELSRIGRSTIDVLETLNILSKKGVNVYFVKQGLHLDTSPMGKMMMAILSAFAEMERDLISQRTIEGQIRARNNGIHIGRPKGVTSRKLKASKEYITQLLDAGFNKSQIARRCNCSWSTLHRFLQENRFITWDGHHQKSLDKYEENKKTPLK